MQPAKVFIVITLLKHKTVRLAHDQNIAGATPVKRRSMAGNNSSLPKTLIIQGQLEFQLWLMSDVFARKQECCRIPKKAFWKLEIR
jgi:hypothetical protein